MLERVQTAVLRGWLRLKHEQEGAQTLEYLALALLIVSILGGATALGGDTAFGNSLKSKFVDMLDKIK